MLNSARVGIKVLAFVATLGILAGCSGAGSSPSQGASQSPGARARSTASLPAADTTLTPGCFLTPAEVEAATGKTPTKPPEASTGPKGDKSCQFDLGGEVPAGGFGCNCLATNGPTDLEGELTAWLDNLPPGGEKVPGVGDGAYLRNASTGNDFWVARGRISIHISISFQFLTVAQFTTLANAAFDHIDAGEV